MPSFPLLLLFSQCFLLGQFLCVILCFKYTVIHSMLPPPPVFLMAIAQETKGCFGAELITFKKCMDGSFQLSKSFFPVSVSVSCLCLCLPVSVSGYVSVYKSEAETDSECE